MCVSKVGRGLLFHSAARVTNRREGVRFVRVRDCAIGVLENSMGDQAVVAPVGVDVMMADVASVLEIVKDVAGEREDIDNGNENKNGNALSVPNAEVQPSLEDDVIVEDLIVEDAIG